MKREVLDYLIDEYNKLPVKKEITAIKFYFQYNNVNVNMYFDNYDVSNPTFVMVLIFEKKYYYTTLNVYKDNLKMDYLPKIPSKILGRILNKDGNLDSFLKIIENNALNSKLIKINYNNDKIYTNTIKYQKTKLKDYPFLAGLRKASMQDKTLEMLYHSFGIDKNILYEIQRAGYTLVRTSKPKRRKKLQLY